MEDLGKPTVEEMKEYFIEEFHDNDGNQYYKTINNTHYVLIKDFNKFMYNQTKHKHKKYFCMHCLQCFSSEDVINKRKIINHYSAKARVTSLNS